MNWEEHYRKLENMMHEAPFRKLVDAKIRIWEGHSVLFLPVREAFFHAAGAMHGAYYFLALDNAAYFAASSLEPERFILTTSMTTYLTRPVSEGVVRAEGRVVNRTRSQFIAESVLYNAEDKEIARASGVFQPGKTPLSADIGYK